MVATLLERDAEIEVLAAALERAVTDGEGTVVLVAGEAGIGKTSLLRDVAVDLVVSVRTVDHHVSAVLQKLGAATRKDAVAVAQHRGLL